MELVQQDERYSALVLDTNPNRDTIDRMVKLLDARGFPRDQVFTSKGTISQQQFLEMLTYFLLKTKAGDRPAFFLNLHGGVHTGVPYISLGETSITIPDLYLALNLVQGDKLLALYACHAGAANDYLRRRDIQEVSGKYCVITSCRSDETTAPSIWKSEGKSEISTVAALEMIAEKSPARRVDLSKVRDPFGLAYGRLFPFLDIFFDRLLGFQTPKSRFNRTANSSYLF